jgi:hypothetical protein
MFIGHHGVAFAAKAAAPRVPLGVLVLASMWLDVVWPVFLLTGIEVVDIKPGLTQVSPFDFVSYPYSHSLLFALLWALAFGLVYGFITRDRAAAALVGLVVASHWLLDLIVHRADLPLYPGGAKFGLGLWNSWAATLAAEFLVFGVGVWLYCRATRPNDRVGSYGLAGLVIFLVAAYIASLAATPPNDAHALGWGGLTTLLFPLWAWWVDRHRSAARR